VEDEPTTEYEVEAWHHGDRGGTARRVRTAEWRSADEHADESSLGFQSGGTAQRSGLADWWASRNSSAVSNSRGAASRPSLGEVIACGNSAIVYVSSYYFSSVISLPLLPLGK
jgi:hypothetical protein